MHCESELSTAFLHTAAAMLGVSSRHRFLKTVRTNIQQYLVAREQQLLVDTEEMIALDKKIDQLVKIKVSVDAKRVRLGKYIRSLKAQRENLALADGRRIGGGSAKTAPCARGGCIGRMCTPKESSSPIFPQGVVVASCSVCSRTECVDCGAALEDASSDSQAMHKCSAADLDTTRVIASTTRKCPCCSVPIERASGCSQMFCTVCRVSFDWRTGSIVRRNIHNPHFFEWRRAQTCAEDRLTHPIFTNHPLLDPSTISDKDLASKVSRVYSSVISIGAMLDAPGGGRWCPPHRATNADLRKKLLQNSISMEAFTRCVERRNIANCRKSEFRALLDTARAVCLDYLGYIQHVITEHETAARASDSVGEVDDAAVCGTIRAVMQRIHAYREIANAALSDAGVMYGGVDSPHLDDAWGIAVCKNKVSAVTGVKRKVGAVSST
jgi:hypothetical protein